MKTYLILLSLLLSATAAARDLSFEQAVTLARDHSLVLKKGRADRDAYQELLRASVAERYPTLEASMLASYKDAVPQLDIQLPTGQSFTRSFGFHETYQTDLRLQLPLFTGGKISGNIGLSRAARDRSEALLQAGDEQLTLSVRVAYLSLLESDQIIALSEAGLNRAEVIENDVQSLFAAGMADSVGILEARRAVNQARLAVKSAQLGRRQREIELIVLLGLDPEDSLMLTSLPPEPKPPAADYTGISPDRPDLQAAEASIAMNRSLVTLRRSDYFPTVAVFGGWSYGKPNIDPFHDKFNDYFTVGARLNWSLNLGFKTGRTVAGAKHQLRAAEREYDRINEQFDRQARLDLETIRLAYARYQTALENRAIARDNYRLAKVQHRDGALSANHLLDIEAALRQAESASEEAATAYYIATSKYLFTIGSDKLEKGF